MGYEIKILEDSKGKGGSYKSDIRMGVAYLAYFMQFEM
jgi:hypothetical protein